MEFLFFIHVVICVLLVLVILFQDGKTGGLVSVADTADSVFGARGAGSFLTKLTSGLAIAFMVTSLWLAFSHSPDGKSIAADHVPAASQTTTPQGVIEGEEVQAIDKDGNPVPLQIKEREVFKESELPPELKEEFTKQHQEELARTKAAEEAAKKDQKEDSDDAEGNQ